MSEQVLIATLGTEPQVVTLTLDLLQVKGYVISEIIVVHAASKPVRSALNILQEEFSHLKDCRYRAMAIESDKGQVTDIATEADTAALLRTLYHAVLAEKRAGRLVHLGIAGGRKPMAIYAMVVAQLLFDQDDRVWHLLSPEWKPGSKQTMHLSPEVRVSLVPVPVLRWSAVSPVLTELALHEDPWEAIQAQRFMQQEETRRRKREFVEHWLTPAERKVVWLASLGLDNAGIAQRLNRSEKTVANQFTSIYAKFHEWRGFRTDVPVSRAALVAEFALYFALEGGGVGKSS